jgi:hypothetical protein
LEQGSPRSYASTPLTRYSAFGRAIYDLTEDISVFAQGTFVLSTVDTVLFPTPLLNFTAHREPTLEPEERAWLDTLFDGRGFVDAFRAVNPESDQYTWWSNRGRAYEKNVGWRIDYQVTSPCDGPVVRRASIYKGERFSDHAPLVVDYDLEQWTPRLAQAKLGTG